MISTARAVNPSVCQLSLERRRCNSCAKRLGKDQQVAWFSCGIGGHDRRIDDPCHCEPVLRLRVVDRMATNDCGAGFGHDVCAAGYDLAQQIEGEIFTWPADELECRQRRTTHRIDVGEGVGGSDPSPVVGVVHDRGEEIYGLDQGAIIRNAVYARVV